MPLLGPRRIDLGILNRILSPILRCGTHIAKVQGASRLEDCGLGGPDVLMLNEMARHHLLVRALSPSNSQPPLSPCHERVVSFPAASPPAGMLMYALSFHSISFPSAGMLMYAYVSFWYFLFVAGRFVAPQLTANVIVGVTFVMVVFIASVLLAFSEVVFRGGNIYFNQELRWSSAMSTLVAHAGVLDEVRGKERGREGEREGGREGG